MFNAKDILALQTLRKMESNNVGGNISERIIFLSLTFVYFQLRLCFFNNWFRSGSLFLSMVEYFRLFRSFMSLSRERYRKREFVLESSVLEINTACLSVATPGVCYLPFCQTLRPFEYYSALLIGAWHPLGLHVNAAITVEAD